MQVNLIISATSPAQKKINTTISYLRQNQKSRAHDLAVALNQLTKNVFQSATVNEMNVDPTESQNLPQEISVTYQYVESASTYIYTIHRLGTGTISAYKEGTRMTVDQSNGTFSYNSPGPFTILVDSDNTYSQGFLIYTRS